MAYTYASPEIKATRSYQRAEQLEKQIAPNVWNTPGLTPGDMEVLADAWEEAGFLGWADNYRVAAKESPRHPSYVTHMRSKPLPPERDPDLKLEDLRVGDLLYDFGKIWTITKIRKRTKHTGPSIDLVAYTWDSFGKKGAYDFRTGVHPSHLDHMRKIDSDPKDPARRDPIARTKCHASKPEREYDSDRASKQEREYDFDLALQRLAKPMDRMTDLQAGQLVRHMQVFYLGHKNGYEPGGPKHNPHLWAMVYKNAGEWRDPNTSRKRKTAMPRTRRRDPPSSRRKIHPSSYTRELRPRSKAPRGMERPIGAGYILSAYPYPFGRRPVAWHVYHTRNPNEWYAAGEADSFDDALDAADRRFGVNLRAAERDPSHRPRSMRPTPRQRAFIAKKIPLLIHEGYPQKQAVVIALRMAGVPPRSQDIRSKRQRSRKRQ